MPGSHPAPIRRSGKLSVQKRSKDDRLQTARKTIVWTESQRTKGIDKGNTANENEKPTLPYPKVAYLFVQRQNVPVGRYGYACSRRYARTACTDTSRDETVRADLLAERLPVLFHFQMYPRHSPHLHVNREQKRTTTTRPQQPQQ